MPTMIPRSQTRDLKSFTLVLGSGPVTFNFPSLHRTRIAIPPGSLWRPGPHWHESYVEHMRVVQGAVKFTVNGTTTVVSPEDGPQIIRPYDVHDFCRADLGAAGADDGDVVVEEWTEPDDGFKQVFFYNVLSLFKDSVDATTQKARISPGLVVQLLRTIAYVDNFVDPLPFFPSSVPALFAVKYLVTHAVYGVGKLLGSLLGYQPWFKEYTPKELWDVAEMGSRREEGFKSGRGKIE